MGLLDAMLEKKIRMVDYECIREAKSTGSGEAGRLVAFGRYAGIAGAFDFFRGVGEFLLSRPERMQTPFIFLGSSYMYEDYDAMKGALESVARGVSRGLPKTVSPLVFGVTGTGRVSQGIMEVLQQLPHVLVDPDQLKNLSTLDGIDNKRIIIS
jgi:alpha-aminoadipic semialdehyde synthase